MTLLTKYPKIKFKTDIKTDILNCFYFIKYNHPQKHRHFLL